LGTHDYGTSNLNRVRSLQRMRNIKNVHEDLDFQIYAGWIQANLQTMTQDEILKFFVKVSNKCDKIDAVRLTCIPKEFDIPWDQRNDPNCTIPEYKYGKRRHRMLAREKADLLLGDLLRSKFTTMVKEVMLQDHAIHTLELGVTMSDSGLAMLSDALSENESIERFSLCGSCIGNHGLTMLKDGLMANKSLKELDLTGCALTDLGAKVVVSILKAHSTNRGNHFWREMLREYPNDNEGNMKQRIFERTKAQVQSKVAVSEGGLLLLELRENKVTDEGAHMIFDAVMYDMRIVLLSIRKNKIGVDWQEHFAALLREHPSLQQVDLRGNRSSYMGLLRKRNERNEVMLHLSRKKQGADKWKGLQIAAQPVKDTYCLSINDVMDTPREEMLNNTEGDGRKSPEGGSTPRSGAGSAPELLGNIEDPGLSPGPASSGGGGSKKGSKSPVVPRLRLGLPKAPGSASASVPGSSRSGRSSGRASPSATRLRPRRDPSKQPKPRPREGGAPAAARVGARRPSIRTTPAAGASAQAREKKCKPHRSSRKAEGRATGDPAGGEAKANTRKKKAAQARRAATIGDDSVEQLSAVLLQLHELVTGFESAAQKDPQLMSRMAANAHKKAGDLHNRGANNGCGSPALYQVASQLKRLCHLDDSAALQGL